MMPPTAPPSDAPPGIARPSPKILDPAAEQRQLVAFFGEERPAELFATIQRQFHLLQGRAQVLLSLAGIAIATTGFSGRLIAGTHPLAQGLIIGGLATVLLSAVVVVGGVLGVNWLTQLAGPDLACWLRTAIEVRNRKTRYYAWGMVLLIVGLAFYSAAIAIMLALPAEYDPGPLRR